MMRAVAILCVALSTAVAQPFVDQASRVSETPTVTPVPPAPTTPAGTAPKIQIPEPPREVLDDDVPVVPVVPQRPARVSLEEPIDPATYLCGPGDAFELDFWGQQNLRVRFAADLEGRAFIPKVGFVAVAGKTLAAVRKAVKDKVRANYPGLQFDLTITAPRTFSVHVVQNVKTPGMYTSSPLERVSSLLVRAGDAKGSRRRIAIKHRGGANANADLVLYELTGDTKYNPYVSDGDVISVPYPEVVVTIQGAIRRPGTFELTSTKDLPELLDLAGGFTSGVVRNQPIRIVRHDRSQHQAFEEIAFASVLSARTHLEDGDIVQVTGTTELERSVLLIGAIAGTDSLDTTTTGTRLPFIEGDTVRSLLERAGGIKAPGDMRRAFISRPRPHAQPEIIPIDLDALWVRRQFAADKPVRIGDTIVVPSMQYSVRVDGAVARAGLYQFNPAFGIQEYLAQAGGRTRLAQDLRDVKLVDTNGHTHAFDLALRPSPGDAILVPERNFSRAEIAQLVLAGAGLVLSGIAITLAATR